MAVSLGQAKVQMSREVEWFGGGNFAGFWWDLTLFRGAGFQRGVWPGSKVFRGDLSGFWRFDRL